MPEPRRSLTRSLRPRGTVAWVLMLGMMAALPALTFDMYLPAVPELRDEMGTTESVAQLTLSMMLIGGALGQLVIGPLTDRFGRRRPAILGITISAAVSLLCALAPNIESLIGLRLFQGFVNAAAQVAAIAVIRDRFTGAAAARVLSRLMLVIGLAPVLAPTMGAYVLRHGDWRLIFYVLAAFTIVVGLIMWRFLPETLPPQRRQAAQGVKGIGRSYLTLLKDRGFLAFAIVPGLGMAILMSYVVGSPFVLKEGYGMTNSQFATLFAANGVALVVSAQVNAALVRHFAPARILRVAITTQLVVIVGLLVLAITGFGGMWAIIVGLWLVLAFQGCIPANATALAMGNQGDRAGAAAAVIGAGQAGLSGVIAPLVGLLGANVLAMAIVMLFASVTAIVILYFGTSLFQRNIVDPAASEGPDSGP